MSNNLGYANGIRVGKESLERLKNCNLKKLSGAYELANDITNGRGWLVSGGIMYILIFVNYDHKNRHYVSDPRLIPYRGRGYKKSSDIRGEIFEKRIEALKKFKGGQIR